MAELVRVRRLSDEEGQRLLQIVRRGEPKMTKSVIRYRRAMVVLASASGNSLPAIARLVAADEDTVREVIHRFNELGMGALDPRWAGGRPRRISAEDEEFLQETLFDTWRFHAFFTTTAPDALDTVAADQTHRRHAIIENVHADLKASALAHLPSGVFNANAAWLVCAVMAFNLTRAAATV